MGQSTLLATILNFYLDSHDFNGYPVYKLKSDYGLSDSAAKELVEHLVSSNLADVVLSGNPHIKPLKNLKVDAQLAGLRTLEFSEHFCLYPKPLTLAALPELRLRKYKDQPYKMALALGEGQLEFRVFDLSVLEHYRNDPRYLYETDSIHGTISVRDKFYESNEMHERDQVFLQSFGFAYDDDMNRAVAVFLRYLSSLSSEHQQLWRTKELANRYTLHPDYFRTSILGEWGMRISIFDAFLEELTLINKMTELMKMPPLFRQTFSEERPREFSFLLRPTLAEFNRFVLLLDQMLSENLNKAFFAAVAIPLEDDETRADGKIVVRARATITLLEAWMRRYFRPVDPEPIKKIFATFRKIRKMRQTPAHKVNEDVFDQQNFKNQRQLIIDAYDAVRYIRQALANHPSVIKAPPISAQNYSTAKSGIASLDGCPFKPAVDLSAGRNLFKIFTHRNEGVSFSPGDLPSYQLPDLLNPERNPPRLLFEDLSSQQLPALITESPRILRIDDPYLRNSHLLVIVKLAPIFRTVSSGESTSKTAIGGQLLSTRPLLQQSH